MPSQHAPSQPENTVTICVLVDAKFRHANQLIAGGDKNLVKTFSEYAYNILMGNLPIRPEQKQKLPTKPTPY